MAVKVINSQAVLRWYSNVLQRDIFVRGAEQVEGADGRVVHCDVDSMDLGLMVGVHFEI